jgi:phage-related protein (TIGR01555 family)
VTAQLPEITPPLELTSLGVKPGAMMYIHPSRVVRMIGADYPDMEMAPDSWGDSCLQAIHDAIRNAGLVSSSISSMISEAKLDIISVPGLTNSLSTTEGTAKIFNRFTNANAAKSVINRLLLDTDEEFDRREIHFSGMDKVMQMYLMIVCGAADIPAIGQITRWHECIRR